MKKLIYFFLSEASAFTDAFTKGTVTLAPFVEASAPRYEDSLALGPTVRVDEQPVKKRAPTANTISVFIFLFVNNN